MYLKVILGTILFTLLLDFADNQELASSNPYFACIKISLVAEAVGFGSALPMLTRLSIGY